MADIADVLKGVLERPSASEIVPIGTCQRALHEIENLRKILRQARIHVRGDAINEDNDRDMRARALKLANQIDRALGGIGDEQV